MNSLDNTIQEYLNRLSTDPSVKLALFCFHPSRDAAEFRFQSTPAYSDVWSVLETVVTTIREAGQCENRDEPVLIYDEEYRLVVTRNGAANQSSFMVALVAGADKIESQTIELLADVSSQCTSEPYLLKWK
ncbi:MAG: hypothetical protein AAFN13_10885 [Bacteroidota bacterium]